MDLSILYEDNHLLVVNKPAGMLTQSDKTQDLTILDMCKSYIKDKYSKPGNVFLAPAHRLDRPVSGCIILGKTSKALGRLHVEFKERKVQKEYIALSNHFPQSNSGIIESYIFKDSSLNISKSTNEAHKGSKWAKLSYEVLSSERVCLFSIKPLTGRSHQIRVQLNSLGCPIIGDVKYGGIKWQNKKAIALHCYSLGFIHPVKKTNLRVNCLPQNNIGWNSYKSLLNSI